MSPREPSPPLAYAIIAGLIMLVERPVKAGDWVVMDGVAARR